MQPTGEATYTAGGILCAALRHLSPGTQAHGMCQAEAHNGPGQRAQAANIPGRVVRGMMDSKAFSRSSCSC